MTAAPETLEEVSLPTTSAANELIGECDALIASAHSLIFSLADRKQESFASCEAALWELLTRLGEDLRTSLGLYKEDREKCPSHYSTLHQLQRRYNSIWVMICGIRAVGVSEGFLSRGIANSCPGVAGALHEALTRQVAHSNNSAIDLRCKNHQLVLTIKEILTDGISCARLVYDGVYTPLIQIYHYLQDLSILATDLYALLEFVLCAEKFFSRLGELKELVMLRVKKGSNRRPLQTSRAASLVSLFESPGDPVTAADSKSDMKSIYSVPQVLPEEGKNDYTPAPFDVLLTIFASLPARSIPPIQNTKSTECQEGLAEFAAHVLQSRFQMMLLGFITDRMHWLSNIVEFSVKNQPETLVSNQKKDVLAPISTVHADRFNEAIDGVMNFVISTQRALSGMETVVGPPSVEWFQLPCLEHELLREEKHQMLTYNDTDIPGSECDTQTWPAILNRLVAFPLITSTGDLSEAIESSESLENSGERNVRDGKRVPFDSFAQDVDAIYDVIRLEMKA